MVDLERTIGEMRSRGVEAEGGIADHGYGPVTRFRMPGDFATELYQPRYTIDRSGRAKAKR